MCWPETRHGRTASADNNHRRTVAADSGRQLVVEAGSKEDPPEGWPPTQGSATSKLGDAGSDNEQQQGCFSAVNNNLPARTTATLSLHQHGVAVTDTAHHIEMLAYAGYAYAATNCTYSAWRR